MTEDEKIKEKGKEEEQGTGGKKDGEMRECQEKRQEEEKGYSEFI